MSERFFGIPDKEINKEKSIFDEKITRREFVKVFFSFLLTLLISNRLEKAEKNIEPEKRKENLYEKWEKMEESVVDALKIATFRSQGAEGIEKTCKLIEGYSDYINKAIEDNGYEIDPDFLKSIIFIESNGNPDKKSNVHDGAVGLMQLLPETAKEYGISEDDRYDPEKSIDAAVKYLQKEDKLFGSQDLAIGSYHIGLGNTADLIILYAKKLGIKDLKELDKIITDNGITENDITYREIFFNNSASDEILDYSYKENNKKISLRTNTYKVLFEGLKKDNAPLYLWKIKAIAQIIKEYRENSDKLKSEVKKYVKMEREDVLKEVKNKLKKDGFNDEQIKKLRLEEVF